VELGGVTAACTAYCCTMYIVQYKNTSVCDETTSRQFTRHSHDKI